jgi:hypothetical protein
VAVAVAVVVVVVVVGVGADWSQGTLRSRILSQNAQICNKNKISTHLPN